MNQPRLVSISYTASPTVATSTVDAAIQTISLDWMRYSKNSYLLWTSATCKEINLTILRVPGLMDSSIVSSVIDINGESHAVLPNWAWEWLAKHLPVNPAAAVPINRLLDLKVEPQS